MWDLVADTQFKPFYYDLPEEQRQITLIDMFEADDNFNFSKTSFALMKPVYRREFIIKSNIQYNQGMRVGEDFNFYVESLFNGAKVILINEAYYIYSMLIRHLADRLTVALFIGLEDYLNRAKC